MTETRLYAGLAASLEARYPRLKTEQFFARLKAFMVICDPAQDARNVGGTTWILRTS